MADIHYLGEFPTFNAVWKMFPNGGGYGDYVTILGVHYDWDESKNSWGDDPGDVNPALPEVVNHDIDVQGTVTARDGIKTADYIQGEAGAFIDGAGDAEFRSVNVDALWVKDPVTGERMSLPDFIKKYKTELPPDWAEYEQITQFDNVRILAFDPLSQEKFYTTIGALKKLISDSIGAGSTGGGTFDIEILRSDDPEGVPTDNNVYSSLKTIQAIQAALAPLIGQYLSRINDDTAQGLITFIKGIEVGEFTPGALGSGAAVKMVDGTSYAEVDNLTVRQKATFRELIIESLKHIGGQLVLTPARMKCVRVVEEDTFYKCYFDTGDGEVSNEFVAGDFARCQVFTGSGTKFYWRLVTLVGEDWINISKTSAAEGSDAPEAGDDITQLGNAADTTRQSAIILSTVGIDAPSWKQYNGIDSFSLEGKETTVFSKLGNRITGETVFTSGGANLDDYLDGVAQDILDALRAAQDAEDKAQEAIEEAEANVTDYNAKFAAVQAQIDGEVSNWFYAYSPTLANYPASDWTTNEIKDRHIGDTFTNTAQAPATDAGKSWRFVKNGSIYSWTLIADSDAVKALLEASKAQATADGKSTTHLFQPTKYKLGDMWVLNADQTVNGTLYKQGELLTATQDSETFVPSHWLKRIRYTDDTAVNNLQVNSRNYVRNSRLDNLTGWSTANGTRSIVIDPKFGNVVQWARTSGSPADYQKEFALVEKSSFEGAPITLFVIAKRVSTSGSFCFGWNGWTTFITASSSDTNQIDLGGGWFVFWRSSTGSVALTNSTYFGINTISGTWQFYAVGLNMANKYAGWQLSNEDVQANIDAAVIKATYWSIKASAPVIYKDAINAATSGTHTPVIVSGELRSGTTTTQGGFISIQPNGGAESTATASPRTIAPTNAEGKTSYTVRLYDTASKTTLLDTQTIPVVFKGASGVNAINASLSNEADVLPASPEGVVSDYTGSGAIIRVFEGATELTYGTGNGQYQVSASGSGITAGTPSTSGNTRVYGVASNMTADNATITFTISGKTASGASFSITKVQSFAKSRTGQKGADGVSITMVDVEFAKNTNVTTPPAQGAAGWTTTAPAITGTEQLWTRTKTAYSSGSPTYSTPANITPKTGATGQGIDSVTEEYHISSSKTTQPAEGSAGWSTTQPTWVQGQYIWSRVKVVYKNPASTVYTGYAVSSEWEAINELEIGGRNYFSIKEAKLVPIVAGHKTVTIQLLPNTQYIASTSVPEIASRTYNIFADKNPIARSSAVNGLAINKPKLITTDSTGKIDVSAAANIIDLIINGTYYFKLEKGNKATDWTPAPEDAEREVLEAQGYMRARYVRDWSHGSDNNANANHWREVEVINKSGVNLARNKVPTTNGNPHASYPLINATDGDINTTAINGYNASVGASHDYIQIDLGQVYYDIDFIRIIHSLVERITFGTKTEISEDGITWKTIFDSAVSGTYVETEGGKVHTQRYASEEAQGFMKARYIRDWAGINTANNYSLWYEVKVFNKAGNNVAQGKSVEGKRPAGSSPYSNITDGDTTTYGQPSGVVPEGETDWVKIDLGQIYYDIDYIQVWHYSPGGRTYYGTKTEISEDGITWKTIFDSEISGTYAETEGGKVHTQRYASVMDRIAETEAKTRFQTLIDGGLIYTALMKLFDTISGDETAFISGKQGAGKNLPAFGAGGSYQDALAGTAKAIIRHDGSSKFTDAEIEGSIVTNSGNDKITLNENNDNQLKFRHSNGTVAAMFGMSDGEPALIWYDSNGNETWRAGQNGIVYVEALVVDGNCEYMSGGVEYQISFTNNSSNTQSLTQVEFLIRYKDNDISQEVEELEPGETIVSLGDFSIASHQTINFGDHIMGVLPNMASRGGFIYLSYKTPANKYRYFNIAYS